MQVHQQKKFQTEIKRKTPEQRSSRGRDFDYKIVVLDNLNLEEMEMKSKGNLSNMEQNEPSKLSDDETIVIKAADKRGSSSNSVKHFITKT